MRLFVFALKKKIQIRYLKNIYVKKKVEFVIAVKILLHVCNRVLK